MINIHHHNWVRAKQFRHWYTEHAPELPGSKLRLRKGQAALGHATHRALVLVRGAWWQSLSVLVVMLMLILGFFVLGALAGFVLADLLPMSVVTALLAALFQPFVTATGWAQYQALRERQASSSASNSL